MLKFNLTQEEFDALEESQASLYKQEDDGYQLSVDLSDYKPDGIKEMKRGKDREIQKRKDAELELKEANVLLDSFKKKEDALTSDQARKKGDIATLEKSWESKLTDSNTAYDQKIDKYKSQITSQLIDLEAKKLAFELGGEKNSKVLLPHIKSRMSVDFEGDEAKRRISSVDGELSAMNMEDLKKEFIANPDFASTIITKTGSGSSATGQEKQTGGAIKTVADIGNATDQAKFAIQFPKEFRQILDNS